MRSLTITLGDENFDLVATFRASKEVADKVADPLMIAREAATEAAMAERGLPYQPKWTFTIENIADLVWIGLKAGKAEISRDKVNDCLFDMGFIEAREIAAEYLALFLTPHPTSVKAVSDSGE